VELESAEISDDIKSQVYSRLGWIRSRAGAFEASFNFVDSANKYAQSPLSKGLASSLEGTLVSILDDQEEGVRVLLEAITYFEEAESRSKDYGLTLMNISNCYAAMGESVKSGDYLSMSYKPLMEYYGNQHPNYFLIKLFYSRELTEQQEFLKAENLLKEVLEHFQSAKDTASIMHCYHNLTENSVESGDYKKALNYLEINLGLSYASSQDTTYNHGAILNSLISCLRDLEIYEDAELRLQELENLCEDRQSVGQWFHHWIYVHRAFILSDQAKYFEADSVFKVAEKYVRDNFGQGSENMADLYYFMADNYKYMGASEQALSYLEKASSYYESNYKENNHNNINTLVFKGEILETSGYVTSALDIYIKAKDRFDEEFGAISIEKDMVTDIQTVIGRDELYVALLRASASLIDSSLLDKNETLQALIWLEEAKAYYHFLISELHQVADTRLLIEQFHEIGLYGQRILNHLYQKSKDKTYVWDALSLAELSKNYARKIILNDRNAKQIAHIPDSLLELDKHYNQRIQYLEKLAQEQNDSEARFQLNIVRNEWDEFIDVLETRFPEYYQLKYDPYTATGLDIQEWSIEKNTDILYFFQEQDYLVTYYVNEKDIQVDWQSGCATLDSMIAELRSSMVEANVPGFYENGSYIYEKIWKPLGKNIKAESLCIVPDQSLAYLNFEALPLPSEQMPQSFKDMSYLIQEYSIGYRYEFTSSRQNSEILENHFLCEKGVAFIPVFESEVFSGKVSALPWSLKLANFLRKNFEVDVFEKEQSTKDIFWQNAQSADLLHFSTHAITSQELPMESFLLFRTEEGDLDSLTALDVIQTDLAAHLTSLSACETGISEFKVGLGLQSLAWSFEYAGCDNLLVSLWSIDDEITADILERFYSSMKGKYFRVSKALREAKLDAIQKANIHQANPYYWAGMIYLGDNPELQIQETSLSTLFIVSSMIVLLAGIFFLFQRKGVNFNSK
jgi:CHAT domain-containing protein